MDDSARHSSSRPLLLSSSMSCWSVTSLRSGLSVIAEPPLAESLEALATEDLALAPVRPLALAEIGDAQAFADEMVSEAHPIVSAVDLDESAPIAVPAWCYGQRIGASE